MAEAQTKTREAVLDELLAAVCAAAEAAEFNGPAFDTLTTLVIGYGKAVPDLTMAELVRLVEQARERFAQVHGDCRCYVAQGRA